MIESHLIDKKTSINNLLMGTIYIDNHGKMEFKNYTTGDTGELNLTQRGWSGGGYEVDGWVKNAQGAEVYKIKGSWNKELIVTHRQNKETNIVWKFVNFPDGNDIYYGFEQFSMDLNILTPELATNIVATDCRLRPDQRALELGWIPLAASEKNRLEQK